MAKNRVVARIDGRTGKVKLGTLNISTSQIVSVAAKNEVTQRIARDHYESVVAKATARQMTLHLQNLLKQIEKVLERGVKFSSSVPIGRVGSGRIQMFQDWDSLTEDYRKRKLETHRDKFWRGEVGTSLGGGRWSPPLLTLYKSVITPSNYKVEVFKVTVKRNSYKKTSTGASIRVVTDFRATPLPEPIEHLVRKPFFSGGKVDTRASRGATLYNKRNLTRLMFVEERRPLVSGMAAILGRLMYQELSLK